MDLPMAGRPPRLTVRVVALVACLAGLALPASTLAVAEEPIDFNRDISPILSNNCYFCHGPDPKHREADLRLDQRDSAVDDIGAIVPGEPDDSELIARILSDDEFEQMPPPHTNKKLSAEQVDLLRRWIAAGAEWDPHWAYAPPQPSVPPAVKQPDWPINNIDRWILARLEREGIEPSPEADRRTLIRRLSFDLTGLPPTPEEVQAFVDDSSPDAYEKLVDRLLASPHYGERMAMYWLDLVRYADTVGYHGDQGQHVTPYRDYVIDAFNDNMPFDQFTIEQLAGDLLENPTVDQIVATGYNRLLQTTHEGGAQDKEYLSKYLSDRVRNVSAVWMAGTMGCAECHDHKYDPYSQKDFFSLGAFFADVKEQGAYNSPNSDPTTRPPQMQVLSKHWRAEQARLQQELEQAKASSKPDAKQKVEQLEAELKQVAGNARTTLITESVKPREIRILPRGDWLDDSGEVVEPAVPGFLSQIEKEGRATRLDLARWLVEPENPQTSRVFVNRLWYLFFGEGLSKVLDDFGAQGETPVHPELLDMLAVDFVESGWDVKQSVKQLVMSRAYRQSSLESPALRERDRFNRLVARQSRFRLPAEMIRDNSLAVSGLLVREIGGASAKPYQPAKYYQHLNFPKREYKSDANAQQWRRGVYVHWQRMFLHPALLAFDAPSREECTAKRTISNTPKAALAMLNDPSQVEAARHLAARLMQFEAASVADKIALGAELVLSRPPSDEEAAVLAELYAEHLAEYQTDPAAAADLLKTGISPQHNDLDQPQLAAWTSVARTLLNLNETIMRN